MLLGEIIKNYREDHNLSLQDFANLIGSSRSYIHMLEKNVNPSTNKPINPSIETLKLLANAMNMNLEDLLKQLNENQPIFLDETEYKKQFKKTEVLIYGTIPAGIPMEMIEDVLDTEEISADMLKGGKQFFGLKIKGNSMIPEYREGDVIICEKVDDCESGDDVIVMINGNDGTFKKIIKNENGIILQPLNLEEYQPMSYSNEDIKKLPIKIIGKVVELRRRK